jgi:hypothetical protein
VAASLKHITTTTITTNTSEVQITGLDDTSVYIYYLSNVTPSTDGAYLRLLYTESGTPNTTSNYDYGAYYIRSNSSFVDLHNVNQSGLNVTNHTSGTAGNESVNAEIMITGHNRSNEYTFAIINSVNRDSGGNTYGVPTAANFTVYSVVDGAKFYFTSGNIAQGQFSLYKVLA